MIYKVNIEDGIFENIDLDYGHERILKKLQKYAKYFQCNISIKINKEGGGGLAIYVDNKFFALAVGAASLVSPFKDIQRLNLDIYSYIDVKNKKKQRRKHDHHNGTTK